LRLISAAIAIAVAEPTPVLAQDVPEKASSSGTLPSRKFQGGVAGKNLGGVPVLEIAPKGWADDGRLLICTHGGGYTFFSARSSLGPERWPRLTPACV